MLTVLKSKRRLIGKKLLQSAVVVLVFWFAGTGFAAWRMIHRPRKHFAEPVPKVDGLVIESHRLSTADGQQIGAWYVRPQPGRGTVLILHGYRSCRTNMLPLVKDLAADGRGVLAVSLRAHGDSTGSENDVGYSARHDVVAAVEFLEARQPGERIVVCGNSQGAAAAVFAADALGDRVDGYLLDSPYRDLKTAVWNRVELHLPDGLDYAAYGSLRLWAPAFMDTPVDQIDPCARIGDIPESVPVVIAAGAGDRYARLFEAEALFARVESHGRLLVFPVARHGRLYRSDKARYLEALGGLLDGRP